jgi:hypothetical protein
MLKLLITALFEVYSTGSYSRCENARLLPLILVVIDVWFVGVKGGDVDYIVNGFFTKVLQFAFLLLSGP